MEGYCHACDDNGRISRMTYVGDTEERYTGAQYDIVYVTSTWECINCFHREHSCTTKREAHDATTPINDVDVYGSTGSPARFGT